MRRPNGQLGLLCGVLLLGGCVQPGTRVPSLWPRPPALERRLFEFHDPLPRNDLGPETQVRPRQFRTPRTAPRRALEFDLLRGGSGAGAPGRRPPASSRRGFPAGG